MRCLGRCLRRPGRREPARPAPMVYLGRTPAIAFAAKRGWDLGRCYGEFRVKSFLVAARDQLGLRTRDASLGDEMCAEGDNSLFEVLQAVAEGPGLAVRRGPPARRERRCCATLSAKMSGNECRPWRPVQAYSPGRGLPGLLAELEELSRGEFVDALQQAGFQGKPPCRTRRPFPQRSRRRWTKMDFMSQFSAVRQLHELIRSDGESPERLGALVRGYANLGLLTEFHWHPAHKAFKARALVYAQRMVARDKQPGVRVWHRAYAFAHGRAAPAGLGRPANGRDAVEGRQGRRPAARLGRFDRRLLPLHPRKAQSGRARKGPKKTSPAAVVRQRRAFRSRGNDPPRRPSRRSRSFRTATPPSNPSASMAAWASATWPPAPRW